MSDIFETDIDDDSEALASLEDNEGSSSDSEDIVINEPLYHLKLGYSCETLYAKVSDKMKLVSGDYVICPTRYGKDMAFVLGITKKPMGIKKSDIVNIERKANDDDLKKLEEFLVDNNIHIFIRFHPAYEETIPQDIMSIKNISLF